MFFIIVVNTIFGNFWSFSHYLYPTIRSLAFHFLQLQRDFRGPDLLLMNDRFFCKYHRYRSYYSVVDPCHFGTVRIRIRIFSLVALKTSHKTVGIRVFSYYFCLMKEGSGSGSVPLTNGSCSATLVFTNDIFTNYTHWKVSYLWIFVRGPERRQDRLAFLYFHC